MHFEMIPQNLGILPYILLAALVVIEGPIATLAGAVAASAGLMKPVLVFTSAAMGNILADGLWYFLGYMGNIDRLERYGKWVGLKRNLIQRVEQDVQKHAAKMIFVAKLTLGFTIPALVATGMARVPFRRWFPSLLVAETLWTGSLVLLGFYFGSYVQTLERGIEIIVLAGGLLCAVFLIIYLTHLRKRAVRSEMAPLSVESGISSPSSRRPTE